MNTNGRVLLILALLLIALFTSAIYAVGGRLEVDASGDDLFAGLRWRNIGPFHGGRVSAVTGAIGQPGTFYLGAPIGGIWKTTNAGVSWYPIFDQFKNVDSIGAIQVAPSDPNIVYAGTGDSVGGPSGDGMYKSTDAGKTWTHIGLEETTKINKMVVDPKTRTSSLCQRRAMRSTTVGASIERLTAARPGRIRCDLKTRTGPVTLSTPSTCRK